MIFRIHRGSTVFHENGKFDDFLLFSNNERLVRIKIACEKKPSTREFSRSERIDIANVTMNEYDSVTTTIRNRRNYQNRNIDDMDLDDSSTLDRLLNSKMGCETDNHSAEKHLSTCNFTCNKCGLKFHMNCLKKSVQRLNLSSYDHKSGICTICFQKMDVFFRENFVHWENIDLTKFKYLN